MSTKMIHNYTAALTIDAAADLFLGDPASSGVYKSYSRNVMLGISSAAVGLTDSQSITNKVFDNSNSLTVKDGSLTIQNTSSTTKQAVFSAASITAGQTRTFTFPDASGTLATIAGTQTLTNKTITSPAITGGTIDNSAITVDSISGHTSGTVVTVANLQISNGVLNTANSVTATSIADGAIQPKALVAGTGSGWAWSTWSPVWTNLTAGNGTVSYAKYIQIGKTVHFRLKFVLGSTSAITGAVVFSLPVTANADIATTTDAVNGEVQLYDFGVTNYIGCLRVSDTTHFEIEAVGAAGTYATMFIMSSTIPFTWAIGDMLIVAGSYEAA